MIERAQLATLVPHAGAMLLLDRVESWDTQGLRASSTGHRRSDHPLAQEGRLAAMHLVEYAGQAMAAHGGLLAPAGSPPAPGLLVALRGVELSVSHLDDIAEPLEVRVERKLGDARGWVYDFEVRAAARMLARGRATVMFSPPD